MNLNNCRALVTGGGGGLGRYILESLAAEGVDVAVAYNSSLERAEEAAELVKSTGRNAYCVEINLTDDESIKSGVEAAVKQLGGLDILVNNAGVAGGMSFEEFTVDELDKQIAVNLRGPFLLSRTATPHLKASGMGRIVNVGSVIGLTSAVSASSIGPVLSKSCVIPLTRYLAAALAPEVLVNCVAPGLMENTLMSSGASEEYVQQWRDMSVLGQTTSHADVAAQIIQFCKSDTITGQTLVIDGGIHFH
jgi:3-oxoacyl-[acyl-carrier protein] reductase